MMWRTSSFVDDFRRNAISLGQEGYQERLLHILDEKMQPPQLEDKRDGAPQLAPNRDSPIDFYCPHSSGSRIVSEIPGTNSGNYSYFEDLIQANGCRGYMTDLDIYDWISGTRQIKGYVLLFYLSYSYFWEISTLNYFSFFINYSTESDKKLLYHLSYYLTVVHCPNFDLLGFFIKLWYGTFLHYIFFVSRPTVTWDLRCSGYPYVPKFDGDAFFPFNPLKNVVVSIYSD